MSDINAASMPHNEPALEAHEPQTSPQLQTSLPHANSCLSYWHRTTRSFRYLNANSDVAVPNASPYVIIGSGLSGSLTAFSLLESGITASEILLVEAREAVSGSSGRNAGHVRSDAFRGFNNYAAAHGVDQALKIAENENLVFQLVSKFVADHNIACDFTPKPTFDVCLTNEIAADEADNVKEYRKAGGDTEKFHLRVYEGQDAVQRTGIHGALAAYEWPAASIHPAKLTHWLLSNVIRRGCRLWTHCPVSEVTKEGEGWRVHTPRGIVISQKVVHCTNVYAGALLPQLSPNRLTPIRIQVHSVVPTRHFSGEQALESTMALRYAWDRFYALLQSSSDGMIILGVARPSGITFDETSYEEDFVGEAFQEFNKFYPDYPEAKHGEGLDHAWSGLIAMTPDSVPYIGKIEDLPGQYVCAGFNGHGMARIFTCAPGVVKLMLGGTWRDTGLPECFQYSKDRLFGK
jgi:glycine/D-amino acid oxidase-like deaminating enzyme